MTKILCFGDSITFGLGEKPCFGWAGRLKNYIESKKGYNLVYNLGISGEFASDINKRLEIEYSKRISTKARGNFLIIAIGINDTRWIGLPTENLPQTKLTDFDKEIKLLINKVKRLKIPCVFIGLTPVDESKTFPFIKTTFQNNRIKEFDECIKTNCLKNNIPFLDIFQKFSKLEYKRLLDDGLHPNSKGYEKMYELIKEFLIKQKLIK